MELFCCVLLATTSVVELLAAGKLVWVDDIHCPTIFYVGPHPVKMHGMSAMGIEQ